MHSARNPDGFHDVTKKMKIVTDGIEGQLWLDEHAIHLTQAERTVSFLAENDVIELVRVFMRSPNSAMLAGHWEEFFTESGGAPVRQRFPGLTRVLGAHALRKHFVKFDRGASTRYGMMTNSSDPEAYIKDAEMGVRAMRYGKRREAKRLKVIKDFAELYEDRNNPKFSRKKVAGAVMLASIGGTVFYIVHRHRKN